MAMAMAMDNAFENLNIPLSLLLNIPKTIVNALSALVVLCYKVCDEISLAMALS